MFTFVIARSAFSFVIARSGFTGVIARSAFLCVIARSGLARFYSYFFSNLIGANASKAELNSGSSFESRKIIFSVPSLFFSTADKSI